MSRAFLNKPLKSYIRHYIRKITLISRFKALIEDLSLICRYCARRIFRRQEARLFFDSSGKNPPRVEPHFTVINLPSRTDRRNRVRQHLAGLSIAAEFSPGIPHESGAVGCGLAHIRALTNRDVAEDEILVIAEDDIEFLCSREVIDRVISDFLINPALDVLCLGNNVKGRVFPISRFIGITSNTQTTSCYIVKRSSRTLVADTFRKAVDELRTGKPRSKYAIDIYWKKLQRSRLVFSVPLNKIAQQHESYSDIEKKWVKYGQ